MKYYEEKGMKSENTSTKRIKVVRDMGIAGLNLKFNKKVKTNVERESKSRDTNCLIE